jgi:hypothetical protein
MMTISRQVALADLISAVNAGKEMPAYLFSRNFEHHLFIDIDITALIELSVYE